jgi:hypothetical protein
MGSSVRPSRLIRKQRKGVDDQSRLLWRPADPARPCARATVLRTRSRAGHAVPARAVGGGLDPVAAGLHGTPLAPVAARAVLTLGLPVGTRVTDTVTRVSGQHRGVRLEAELRPDRPPCAGGRPGIESGPEDRRGRAAGGRRPDARTVRHPDPGRRRRPEDTHLHHHASAPKAGQPDAGVSWQSPSPAGPDHRLRFGP